MALRRRWWLSLVISRCRSLLDYRRNSVFICRFCLGCFCRSCSRKFAIEFFSMSDLHPNTLRVISAAREAGLEITTRRFPEGTAVDGEIVMAYVSGANQLDEKKLAAAAGGSKCSRVDADAVRAATGYPIGGVPPFGHSTQLRVFVDPDLLQYDEVWAAAGTWNDNFGAAPADIVRVAGGVVTDLKRA
ncbi:MAG: YbaK/EbsC family protein [Actinobacteria bacterium]|nr:YbaK/EbsC family protein [Actinomycetota bacterium]